MAGNYAHWGVCRRCGSEVTITRRYDGKDRDRAGYDCGVCWFRDVAKRMIEHALRRRQARILQLALFLHRRRA